MNKFFSTMTVAVIALVNFGCGTMVSPAPVVNHSGRMVTFVIEADSPRHTQRIVRGLQQETQPKFLTITFGGEKLTPRELDRLAQATGNRFPGCNTRAKAGVVLVNCYGRR